MWRRVWAKIEDIGRENVKCSWVKGHTTWSDVVEGRIRQWLRDGNRAADDGAKRGASCHEDVSDDLRRYKHRHQTVTLVAKYIARMNLHVMEHHPDSNPDRRYKARPARARQRRANEGSGLHVHDLVQVGARFSCWICRNSARTPSALQRKQCHATPQAQHNLWRAGGYTFCIKCGARSRLRIRQLGIECKGAPSSKTKEWELRQLKRGRVPEHTGARFVFASPPVPVSRVPAPGGPVEAENELDEEVEGAKDIVEKVPWDV